MGSFVIKIWIYNMEEDAMESRLAQFEAGVDGHYDKDKGVHATGCRLLHQILRRMQVGVLQDYFNSWVTEAAELKSQRSLLHINAHHNEEMERLQAELAEASQKLHESMDNAIKNKAAAKELKALHEAVLERQTRTKMAIMMLCLRRWI